MEGQPYGINIEACRKLALAIAALKSMGLEIGIVIGGGNIFRGINLNVEGIERTPADQMGMLSTLINGIALQQALHSVGCQSKVLTALECPKIAETYTWQRALEALDEKNVVIFVGGTGNPYFTTDTAASLRASEIHADILLKATKVDGVYSKDPLKHKDAKKYQTLTYSQVLADKLEIMDATAVALCRSSKIPIYVFNMQQLTADKAADIFDNMPSGTLISGD